MCTYPFDVNIYRFKEIPIVLFSNPMTSHHIACDFNKAQTEMWKSLHIYSQAYGKFFPLPFAAHPAQKRGYLVKLPKWKLLWLKFTSVFILLSSVFAGTLLVKAYFFDDYSQGITTWTQFRIFIALWGFFTMNATVAISFGMNYKAKECLDVVNVLPQLERKVKQAAGPPSLKISEMLITAVNYTIVVASVAVYPVALLVSLLRVEAYSYPVDWYLEVYPENEYSLMAVIVSLLIRWFLTSVQLLEILRSSFLLLIVGIMVMNAANNFSQQLKKVENFKRMSDLYWQIILFMKNQNDLLFYVVPNLIFFGGSLLVVENFATMRFHSSLNPFVYILLPLTSGVVMLFCIALLPNTTKVYEESEGFLADLKWRKVNPEDRRWRRAMKSWGIGIGPYGHATKELMIVFFLYVSDYTINALLSL